MSKDSPEWRYLNLRMPSQLFDNLKALADRNRRSKNAEVVARIEASVNEDLRLAESVVSEDAAGYLLTEELNAQLLILLKRLNSDQKKALLVLLNGD